MKKFFKWLGIVLASLLALIVLTPMGLLAPGTAWGEWGRAELDQLGLGYIPAGFDQWSNLWSAPLPDYAIPALNNPTLGYILSAVFGVVIVFIAILAIGWLLARFTRGQAQVT